MAGLNYHIANWEKCHGIVFRIFPNLSDARFSFSTLPLCGEKSLSLELREHQRSDIGGKLCFIHWLSLCFDPRMTFQQSAFTLAHAKHNVCRDAVQCQTTMQQDRALPTGRREHPTIQAQQPIYQRDQFMRRSYASRNLRCSHPLQHLR